MNCTDTDRTRSAVWHALCAALVRYGYVEPDNLPGLPMAEAFIEALAGRGDAVVDAKVHDALEAALAARVAASELAAGERDRLAAEVEQMRNAQGWDPSSPQHAVVRAAIAWRKTAHDLGDEAYDDERALIEAVDALPHLGEQAGVSA